MEKTNKKQTDILTELKESLLKLDTPELIKAKFNYLLSDGDSNE